MARYYSDKKEEAEDTKTIQVWFLSKHGYFKGNTYGTITWTRSGMWGESKSSVSVQSIMSNPDKSIRITYTQTNRDNNEEKNFSYQIPLVTTPCNFGGVRYWFICPWYKSGIYCGRRVGVLYKSGNYFACRHCNELTYHSRNENRRSQWYYFGQILDADHRAEKLAEQIKRPFYAGKPTRKQRQLDKLSSERYQDAVVMKLQRWL